MSFWVFLLNDVAVSLFGSVLSASFCGALSTRRNRRIFWCCMAVIPLLQSGIHILWDGEFLRQIYPLIVHLPLLLVLYILTGKLLWPFIAILSAYLCCQLRRWIALLTASVIGGGSVMQEITELLVTLPLLLFLLHFISPSFRQIAGYPLKSQCSFGVIPAVYYVFDYLTVVYTDLLISGTPVVVEFMPFVCCGAYLIFLRHNSTEKQIRDQMQQTQRSLDIQLSQSVREINALRESQALARQYRHDLRHHLQYLSSCIENRQYDQAQHYISSICSEIEAQKVERYCENEAANLILSAFHGRAEKEGISMNIRGTLPAFIMISDSDLCVLLSNALENALHACKELPSGREKHTIDVQFYEREEKIFLQIINPCTENIHFEKGIPVSRKPDHGIGVQSICAIVEKYNGICSFMVQNGTFILRLSF